MKLTLDLQQTLIQKKLQELAVKLEAPRRRYALLGDLFGRKKIHNKSLYIHGGVGRGKTMLMKSFFEKIQKTPKVYFHFNSFMRKIHEALRDIRKEEKKYKDELIEAVKRVVKDKKLICFDEFQVTDIADAMLLSRIFSYVFSQGVTVVFTSNLYPRDLYKNGLQREIFLEFIDRVLLKNCEVLHLDSTIDYRSQYRQNLAQRYFISNKENREEIKKVIESFTEGKKPKAMKIKVWGRDVKIKKTFASPRQSTQSDTKIAIFNFDDLCRSEFAASDYQAISQTFDLIFLLKLPSLTPDNINELRRLTLFIDEIYENKTALIILAKTKPDKIYSEGTGAEAFRRTVSRLNEIKSDEYWRNSKINF